MIHTWWSRLIHWYHGVLLLRAVRRAGVVLEPGPIRLPGDDLALCPFHTPKPHEPWSLFISVRRQPYFLCYRCSALGVGAKAFERKFQSTRRRRDVRETNNLA